MADIKIAYAATTINYTISLQLLVNNTSVLGHNVDNTSNKYLDYLVMATVLTTTTGVSTTTGNQQVFLQPSMDGTNYADTVNDTLVTVMTTNANDTTFRKGFLLSSAFGGPIPPHFRLRHLNASGASLTATGHVYLLLGIYATSV